MNASCTDRESTKVCLRRILDQGNRIHRGQVIIKHSTSSARRADSLALCASEGTTSPCVVIVWPPTLGPGRRVSTIVGSSKCTSVYAQTQHATLSMCKADRSSLTIYPPAAAPSSKAEATVSVNVSARKKIKSARVPVVYMWADVQLCLYVVCISATCKAVASVNIVTRCLGQSHVTMVEVMLAFPIYPCWVRAAACHTQP